MPGTGGPAPSSPSSPCPPAPQRPAGCAMDQHGWLACPAPSSPDPVGSLGSLLYVSLMNSDVPGKHLFPKRYQGWSGRVEEAGHRALGESWLPLLQGSCWGNQRGLECKGMKGMSTVGSSRPKRELVLPWDLLLGEGIGPVQRARPFSLFWPSRWCSRVWSS